MHLTFDMLSYLVPQSSSWDEVSSFINRNSSAFSTSCCSSPALAIDGVSMVEVADAIAVGTSDGCTVGAHSSGAETVVGVVTTAAIFGTIGVTVSCDDKSNLQLSEIAIVASRIAEAGGASETGRVALIFFCCLLFTLP